MGDSAGADVGFIAGGLCCICCTESLDQWCLFSHSGSGSGTGRQAGCCTRCCKKSFDEDPLVDEQERLREMREARRRREQAASAGQSPGPPGMQTQANGGDVVQDQPEARKSMEVPRAEAADHQKPE